MMWQWHDYNGWWYLVMSVGMIAFWALVAWAIVTVVRGDRAAPSRRPSNAETILAERYARGEIDADEYHRRLDDLRTTGPALSDH